MAQQHGGSRVDPTSQPFDELAVTVKASLNLPVLVSTWVYTIMWPGRVFVLRLNRQSPVPNSMSELLRSHSRWRS